jgi:murein DD-endopeptidase MepM/ murein hydrolase activator NlpD
MSRGCKKRFICLSVLLELSLVMGLGIYILSHYNSFADEGTTTQVADQYIDGSSDIEAQSIQKNPSKIQKTKSSLPSNIGGPYIDAPSLQMNLYHAKNGDNLASIAKDNNLDFFTILSVNGLGESNDISIGQRLRIPNQRGVMHRIRRGESIEDVALMYDVNIRKIIRVNQILDPEDIKSGLELFIPDAKTTLDFQKQLLTKSGIGLEKSGVVHDDDNRQNRKTKTIVAVASKSKKTNTKNSRNNKEKADIEESVKFASGTAVGLPCEKTKTSSSYGYRRDPFNGRRAFHAGTDMTPGYGSDVYAAIEGTVTYAGWMGGYGKLVVVTNKNGTSTRYGHLSKINVRKGTAVRQGQQLGAVGSTGRSTGSHLHFEVRQDDKPLNPIKFLDGKAELETDKSDSVGSQEELSAPAKETASKSSKTSTKSSKSSKKSTSKKTTKSKKH